MLEGIWGEGRMGLHTQLFTKEAVSFCDLIAAEYLALEESLEHEFCVLTESGAEYSLFLCDVTLFSR